MRHLILSLLLLGGNMVLAQNLVIEKQGHFSVSGSVIQSCEPCFCGLSDSCQCPPNTSCLCAWLWRFGGVLGDDARWQGWFLDLDASPWLEQLCNGLARPWQGWPYFGNYGSEAIGRRDVLVRHLAYGHLS